MKEKHIARVSVAQLARMKDKTDLKRLRKMTDAEIVRAAADDPDTMLLDDAWFKRARLVAPAKKQMIAMRLDADILAWLRQAGKGYQTRVNALLRAVKEGRLVPK
jgi:uncharacterized protein (DUF4415 family)